MKLICYYALLLVFIVLISWFLLFGSADSMTMPQMISISLFLGIYVVLISLIGEGKTKDEREVFHRYLANRAAMIAGTLVLSLGILYQLFTHNLDYWLLGALVAVNLVKIISLLYLYYKK